MDQEPISSEQDLAGADENSMRFTTALVLATVVAQPVLAQSAIDSNTWNNIVQYTRFARACYAATCATPPNGSTVLQYFNGGDSGGRATLFRWDAGKQIVLAFRGTATPNDWSTDLDFGLTNLNAAGTNCGSCQVHNGFQKYYNSISLAVITAVQSAISSTGYSFVITGHSLGGALASIATASFGGSGVKISAVYTYGEPRNGNSAFGSYALGFVPSGQYYRVTHSNDGVPSIPPSILGYTHHGDEYWEQNSGFNNTQQSTVQCTGSFGLEPLNCNLGQNFGDNPINYAHVSYSNDVIGNVLHIHDCGAPYP